jgi:hypothetical protein
MICCAKLIVTLRGVCSGASLSGRSAAWLARLVRDQEVDGSNPFAPTTFLPYIQDGSCLLGSNTDVSVSALCPILCPPSLSTALNTASSEG